MQIELTSDWREAYNLAHLESRSRGFRYNISSRESWINSCDFGWVLVAKEDNVITGALCANPTKDGSIYIKSIVVDPKHQGQGIGSNLLQSIISIAENENRNLLLHVQESNTTAVRLYRKFGFLVKESHSNIWDKDSHYYLMVKFQVKDIINERMIEVSESQ